MTQLEARVNGVQTQYEPGPLAILYERLTFLQDTERVLDIQVKGKRLEARMGPHYAAEDELKYRIKDIMKQPVSLPEEQEKLINRIQHPGREIIQIRPKGQPYTLVVDRNAKHGTTVVKHFYTNGKRTKKKSFGMDDLESIERYVRVHM